MRGLRVRRALTFQQVFGHDINTSEGRSHTVTVESARRSMAVWACQSLISGDIANLPFQPFRKVGEARESLPYPTWLADPNPLNPNFTDISYKRQVGLSEVQNGNAFIAVYPDVFDPVRLLVLNPTQVEIKDGDISPVYDIRSSNGLTSLVDRPLTPMQLIHIPFILPPGQTRGLNPIEAAAQGIAIDLAAQTQGGKFLDGGGLVTGVIEVPREAGTLDQKQLDDLRESFKRRREGPKGYSIGVLEGGASYKPVAMNQKDAQYIETRKFQLEEIARLYLIPPFMVGSQEAAGVAYASSVEREQHYIDHCLIHYAGPIEAGHRRLLPGPDTYMKFNFNALLRGSPKERAEFYDSGLQNKWLFLEDVARWEELDPNRTGTYLETPNNNGPREAAPAPQRSLGDVEIHPPDVVVNVPPVTVNVPEPVVNITTPPVTVTSAPAKVEVRATAPVTVNTPDKIAITSMPTRATTRKVTSRDKGGHIESALDVETDFGG